MLGSEDEDAVILQNAGRHSSSDTVSHSRRRLASSAAAL